MNIGNPDYFGQSVFPNLGTLKFVSDSINVSDPDYSHTINLLNVKAQIDTLVFRIEGFGAAYEYDFELLIDGISFGVVQIFSHNIYSTLVSITDLFDIVSCEIKNNTITLKTKFPFTIHNSLSIVFSSPESVIYAGIVYCDYREVQ